MYFDCKKKRTHYRPYKKLNPDSNLVTISAICIIATPKLPSPSRRKAADEVFETQTRKSLGSPPPLQLKLRP
jgi:hypothetical protein